MFLSATIKITSLLVDCNVDELQAIFQKSTGIATLPIIYCKGTLIGDFKTSKESILRGHIGQRKTMHSDYSYDLIVIGGGSGGLACAKVLF